jgi:hypothetical protein
MQPKFSKLLHKPLIWKSDGLFKSSQTLYDGDNQGEGCSLLQVYQTGSL